MRVNNIQSLIIPIIIFCRFSLHFESLSYVSLIMITTSSFSFPHINNLSVLKFFQIFLQMTLIFHFYSEFMLMCVFLKFDYCFLTVLSGEFFC